MDAQLLTLIEKAKRGDRSAMRSLIELSQDRLFRFALYLTANRALAQDLCQESYIKLLGHLNDLRDPKQFWSWLFRILKNLFLDAKRSPRNQGYKALDDISTEVFVSSKEAAEQLLDLTAALAKLEDNDRAIIILIEIEGNSYAEAAEVLEISENAVRSRLHRARQALSEVSENNELFNGKNSETKPRRQSS